MPGESGADDEAGLNTNGEATASMETEESQGESIESAAADGVGDKEVDCTGAEVLDITSPPEEKENDDEIEKKKLAEGEEEAAAAVTDSNATASNNEDEVHSNNGLDPIDMLPKGKGTILCRFCRKDLGHGCRIRCAECELFDLCLACFSAGIKLDGHEPYHPYRVSDALEFPIFHKDWMVSDELKLLDGVQRYGLGNWDDMSVQVFNKSKSARQIREHYLDNYFGTFGSVLPPEIFVNKSKCGRPNGEELVTEPLPATEDPSVPHFGKKVNSNFLATESMADIDNWRKQRAQSERPASPDDVSMTQSSLVDEGGEEEGGTGATQAPDQGETNPSFLAGGGMRMAANKEKDNTTSAAASYQRNVKSIPGYGLVGYMPLRGDFDTEYDQDAEQILADLEFSDSDEPSERQLKLDVIAIYNKRLDERQRRKDFVVDRNLLDYKRIQMEDRRRPHDEREIIARMRVLARFHSQEEHDALVENVITTKRLRCEIEKLQGYQKLGMKNLSEVAAYVDEKERKDEMLRGGRVDGAVAFRGDGNSGWSSISSGVGSSVISKRHRPWGSQIEGWGSSDTAAQGEELLSGKEKELCAALGLLPRQYLVTKAAIVKESAAQGFVDRESARRLVRLDVKQVDSAFDFFVSCGWISSGPPDTSQNENGDKPETVRTAPMDIL